MRPRSFEVRIGEEDLTLEVLAFERADRERPGRLCARIQGQEFECGYWLEGPGRLRLALGERSPGLCLAGDGAARWLACEGASARVEPARRRPGHPAGREPPREVSPPMPAVVVAVLVGPGERVRAGQPAVVVTAMKMEATLTIPRDGVVAEVSARVGDRVSPGQVLVRLEPPAGREP
jgi:acetyl/propionyl-CoA carboxylase alpha subunit